MKNFKFWKENKINQEYELTPEQLKEKYLSFIRTQEQSWLQYYGAYGCMTAFITDKENGLDSVGENERYPEMEDLLKDTFVEHVYPKVI